MRLVDADKLRYKHSLNTVNTTMPQSFPCITKDEINNAPTVEAIPKADYENRLKADMVAMLEELKEQLREMHEDFFEMERFDDAYGVSVSMDIIQQKINALRGDKDAT